MTPATAWKKLEYIMPNKIGQIKKDKFYIIPLIQSTWNNRSTETEGVVVAGGGGNGELVFSGCRVSVGGAEEVPEMDGAVPVQQGGCPRCH